MAMLNGVGPDRRYSPLPGRHFQDYVDKFEAAAVGAEIGNAVFPAGELMRLKKH